MGKGIVVASYGTIHTETLKKTIEIIENNVKKKYENAGKNIINEGEIYG